MGEALLFGGGGNASGIRQKRITSVAYENLSDSEKYNPYIIWIITDMDATDFTNVYGAELTVKALCWEAYCKLSEEDKMNDTILYIISDKTDDELRALSTDTSSGAKYYTTTGIASSTDYDKIKGVDYTLNMNSTNPISNMAVATKITEIENALGGLKFSVTESGGLRITYDDESI